MPIASNGFPGFVGRYGVKPVLRPFAGREGQGRGAAGSVLTGYFTTSHDDGSSTTIVTYADGHSQTEITLPRRDFHAVIPGSERPEPADGVHIDLTA